MRKFGWVLARVVLGLILDTRNPDHARLWTSRSPTVAALPTKALVQAGGIMRPGQTDPVVARILAWAKGL
jgi:hypothetical protein